MWKFPPSTSSSAIASLRLHIEISLLLSNLQLVRKYSRIFLFMLLDALISKHSEKFRLLPQREIKMAGIGRVRFCLFIDRDVVEILNTQKQKIKVLYEQIRIDLHVPP